MLSKINYIYLYIYLMRHDTVHCQIRKYTLIIYSLLSNSFTKYFTAIHKLENLVN